ncbi:MAG: IS110 family transposase [Gemmatimonadales bacterium]|nr:IS110 family transposase [Gemmatimonadales bacterium]
MTHIAMDVHRKRSTLAYVTPGMAEPEVVRCYTTPKDFAKVLGELPRPWVVCVESTRQSPAVVCWLREMGVDELHLVNAQALHNFTKGKPKTDARDAKEMLDLQLMGRLPECYLATQGVQDWRALSRTRAFIRKTSTAVRNAIRALLNQHGVEIAYRDLQGAAAQEQLAQLQEQLGPQAWVALQQLMLLLSVTEESLKALDAEIEAQVAQQPAAQALTEIPGVGAILAFGFLAEMGEIDRFEAPPHLISYAGLAPRADDSDEYRGPRHLPKRCNKRLRHLAIQATQCASRTQAESRTRAAYGRLVKRLKPNTAKIAAARVLLKDVFYRWNQAVTPSDVAA